MSWLTTLLGRGDASSAQPAEPTLSAGLEARGWTSERLAESIAELEMRILDLGEPGWLPLGSGEGFDFSRDFLDSMVHQARLYAIKNPLIKRTVAIYTNYVWGQGLSITAQGPLNDVIQEFFADRANRVAFSGYKARTRLNRSLMTDGSVALRLFPNISTGRVVVRPVLFDEVRRVIGDPDDESVVRYYLRSWTPTGGSPKTRLYPHIGYRPTPGARLSHVEVPGYGAVKVDWTTPMYLHKVNDLEGMAFGIPEVYAALDWTRAYKEYLENWAKFVRSLTRWAWNVKTTGDQEAVSALASSLDTMFGASGPSVDSNPAPTTGAVAVAGQGVDEMAPVKLGGAVFPSDDGRRLLLMVAAAAGLPETFFGDAKVGTLATAKSLDRPTELNFRDYQSSWAETYTELCDYVVDCAARAPSGALHALFVAEDPEHATVTLADKDPETDDDLTRAIDIDWPPILESDPLNTVQAIALAVKTNAIDDAPLIARMLLTALGEEDIDDALRRLYPQDDTEPEAVPLAKPPAPPATPQTDADDAATDASLAEALEALRPLLAKATP